MMPRKIHTIKSLKERTIDDAGCWIWQGYLGNRIPSIYHDGKMVPVRKLMATLLEKHMPKRCFIHTTCEHSHCVNPEHFKFYTEAQHMSLLLKKSHLSPTRAASVQRYKRAHNAKLSEAIAQEIRLSDESNASLARKYGVNKTIISRVRRNEIWVNTNHPFLSLMR
jgi:hypothetical protein